MPDRGSKPPFCRQNGCRAEIYTLTDRFSKTAAAKRSKRLLQKCLCYKAYMTVLTKTDDPRGDLWSPSRVSFCFGLFPRGQKQNGWGERAPQPAPKRAGAASGGRSGLAAPYACNLCVLVSLKSCWGYIPMSTQHPPIWRLENDR
jgi:hypothetical protein